MENSSEFYEINKLINIISAYSMDYVLEIETWLFNRWYTTTTFKNFKLQKQFYSFFKFNFVNSLMYYDITIVLTLVLLNISGGVFKEHLFKTVLFIQ